MSLGGGGGVTFKVKSHQTYTKLYSSLVSIIIQTYKIEVHKRPNTRQHACV